MATISTASSCLPWSAAATAPPEGVWDVKLLIREIEENLGAQVIDIPFVYNGSNNYVSSGLQPS